MTTVEILQKARDLVARPDGWCQHRGTDDKWRMCMSRALYESQKGCTAKAAADVAALLNSLLRTDSLVDWNDAPGRTQKEVVAAFDKAIERAEGTKA